MLYAGTHIARGRGKGIVTSTGLSTEIGHLATTLISEKKAKPPLLIRIEKFSLNIGIVILLAVCVICIVEVLRGTPIYEIFLVSVALAVAAIPEGLPVVLSIVLAIGMRRMAKRNVIIRKLVAAEALGSCTFIASDKTGTLTMNQLTACSLVIPHETPWEITGRGDVSEGRIITKHGTPTPEEQLIISSISYTATLCNEGFIDKHNNEWVYHGDTVDVALLTMTRKLGFIQTEIQEAFPTKALIPFESEHSFAASFHISNNKYFTHVKGAMEKLLPMCNKMATTRGDIKLDSTLIERQAFELASKGYRVIAFASKESPESKFAIEELTGLTFLGLIGLIDPLRPEAKDAIKACNSAGIKVAMITGDHPATALTIAKEINLAQDISQVITGSTLKNTVTMDQIDALTSNGKVFARIEPKQKLDLVQSFMRHGHFVAVTGDGANDAPALKAAHVGVAMGKSGTDVAKDSSDIVITDDNFASLVAGVEEGRVAYSNVRKVIFFLISTGMGEIVLFTLALISNLPMPLIATQLLWLNLVTNSIQDVALAFEPKEGDEMKRPPRSPKEPIFDKLMIERVAISAIVIGVIAFMLYRTLLLNGWSVEEARNSVLLLMVLYENMQIINSRSENKSAFIHNPLRNPLVIFGTLCAQFVHIAAMYIPWLSDILHIHPVSLSHWGFLLSLAFILIVINELEKLIRLLWKRR